MMLKLATLILNKLFADIHIGYSKYPEKICNSINEQKKRESKIRPCEKIPSCNIQERLMTHCKICCETMSQITNP